MMTLIERARSTSPYLRGSSAERLIDELASDNERLTAALRDAPRPSVSGDEGWPVQYMDWFFKVRRAALESKP